MEALYLFIYLGGRRERKKFEIRKMDELYFERIAQKEKLKAELYNIVPLPQEELDCIVETSHIGYCWLWWGIDFNMEYIERIGQIEPTDYEPSTPMCVCVWKIDWER